MRRALLLAAIAIGLASGLLAASALAQSETADNVFRQGQALKEAGQIREALPLFVRALKLSELSSGPGHIKTASYLNYLALQYAALGRFAEAEPLYKRALAIREDSLGADHPDVATSLNNIASLHFNQGRFAEAETKYKRALAIFEKAHGPDHPMVATNLSNLAVLYNAQGRYQEAVPLIKRSLAIEDRAFGPEHPKIAIGLGNLGLLYQFLERHDLAEKLFKRALAITENALGPDHPNVATGLGNLAQLYGTQGRYSEAEPLFKRALAIEKNAVGAEHPDYARILGNLAELYDNQERFDEAEPLYESALAIKEKALGPEHPDVGTSLNDLASLYHRRERYTEAEPLYIRALEIMGKSLGPDHPAFATGIENYAEMLRQTGRAGEAEKIEARASLAAAGPGAEKSGAGPGRPAPRPETASITEEMGGQAIPSPAAFNLDASALGPLIKAILPPAKDNLDEIKEALARGEYDKAFDDLVPLAERGGLEAQVLLGGLYEEGRGVYENHSMAWHWYSRAGEKGDAEGQFKAGAMHQKGRGVPLYIGKAVEWYLRAAEQDHMEAQTALGLIYSGNIVGGHVDRRKAEKWLTMAVEQGSMEAMRILEGMYVKRYLPRPAERPPLMEEDDIEGEAAIVRRAVTDILDAFVSGFTFKKFNGRVEVNSIRGGSFDITVPSFRVRDSDGASVFIDPFKVNFDPEKRPPKRSAMETDGGETKGVPPDEEKKQSEDAAAEYRPGAYWVQVTLPKSIRFKLDKDGPMFTAAYEQRKYEGLWNRETGNFTDGLIRLKNLRISDPRETFIASADQFLSISKYDEPTPKQWNGTDSYELSGISVNASGKKIITLQSVTVNDEFQGLDIAAYSQAARRAAPGAGGGGKSLDFGNIEPPGGFTLNIAFDKLTAYGEGSATAAALEKMTFGIEAKEMDKPLASFALTYGYNALTSGLVEALNNFFPHDASFALTLERIPSGELAKAFIGSLLGGLGGGGALDLAAGLGAPLNRAKAEMALDVALDATKAALKLNGKLGADQEAAFGVSGGFDLTVNGLKEFVKWASKDLGDTPQAAYLAKASRLAVSEFGGEGKRTSRYRIEMTRQGNVLVNGRDVQEVFATDEPSPVMALGVMGMEPSSLAHLDPKLEALIENYVAAVNAKDLARLKGLLKPEAAACVNDGNKKDYDGFVADEFAFEITPGYKAGMGPVDPRQPLPFTGLVSYPIKPSHYITIDLEDPSAEPGASEIRLGATIVHHAVRRNGEWSLILGCPTPGGFERLRRARAGA